jgi:hypothetical protein
VNERIEAENKINRSIWNHGQAAPVVNVIAQADIIPETASAGLDAILRRIDDM